MTFDIGKASIDVKFTGNDFLTNFSEELLNSLVDRIVNDLFIGSGVPDVGLGEDGDKYVDLAALTFYTKAAGVWGSSTALGNTAVNTMLLINGQT